MNVPVDRQQVAPASEMDRDTFTLHLIHRHPESLGGMALAPGKLADQVEPAYRAFHDRLHATRVDITHSHEHG